MYESVVKIIVRNDSKKSLTGRKKRKEKEVFLST